MPGMRYWPLILFCTATAINALSGMRFCKEEEWDIAPFRGSSNSTTDQGSGFLMFPIQSSYRKQATPFNSCTGERKMVAIKVNATCECQLNTNFVLRDTIPAGFSLCKQHRRYIEWKHSHIQPGQFFFNITNENIFCYNSANCRCLCYYNIYQR